MEEEALAELQALIDAGSDTEIQEALSGFSDANLDVPEEFDDEELFNGKRAVSKPLIRIY